MKLSKILNGINCKIINRKDEDITGISYDSRKVKRGHIFVCISGFVTDGCRFVKQALENGAIAIMSESQLNTDKNIISIVVENCRYAMAIASSNFYNNSSKNMKLIGVTGTNGKTTTTFLIADILKKFQKKVGIVGTIQNQIDNTVLKSDRTTPESVDLQQLFYQMYLQNVEYVVMEVSSHSLALDRVAGCDFDVGIFTNLTQDHLDFHKSMENYRNAKAKLFKICKKGIINIDDSAAKYIADVASCDIISFSTINKSDFRACNIKLLSDRVEFDLELNKYTERFVLPIPGKFNVYNCLGAISACYSIGVPIDIIKEALKNANTVKGRCQSIDSKRGYNIIVDYAHTPDGLKNIISTVNEFKTKKVITVFGCGGDRDKTKRAIMGKIAGELSDFCIITSDNPRSENPDRIIEDIEAGILNTKCKYTKIPDRKEAIRYALNTAKDGDIVLIAGKGHEDYQIFKDKILHFDDVETVNSLLEESNGKN